MCSAVLSAAPSVLEVPVFFLHRGWKPGNGEAEGLLLLLLLLLLLFWAGCYSRRRLPRLPFTPGCTTTDATAATAFR